MEPHCIDYQQLVSGYSLIGLKRVNKLQQRRLDTIRIVCRASSLNVTPGVRSRVEECFGCPNQDFRGRNRYQAVLISVLSRRVKVVGAQG